MLVPEDELKMMASYKEFKELSQHLEELRDVRPMSYKEFKEVYTQELEDFTSSL